MPAAGQTRDAADVTIDVDHASATESGRVGYLLPTGLMPTLRGRHLRLDASCGQVDPSEAFFHRTHPPGVIRVVEQCAATMLHASEEEQTPAPIAMVVRHGRMVVAPHSVGNK
ncbi:hypothetical protein LCGC14_2822940 [marine sediment metagenome]|uniref:Uncharacterized protein n=1 Tax=marine sediment metagenome TaxID=412755 RepID=A0A0F9APX9_9ZZZZ